MSAVRDGDCAVVKLGGKRIMASQKLTFVMTYLDNGS